MSHKGQRILIDMGLALNDFYTRLEEAGIALESIQAIFYTHNHSDHLRDFKSIPKDVWEGLSSQK